MSLFIIACLVILAIALIPVWFVLLELFARALPFLIALVLFWWLVR